MTGTAELIKRLAERAVENGECAAQAEIADAELRASLIRNIEATFADALEEAERVIRAFSFGDPRLQEILFGDMPDDTPGTITVKAGDFRAARDWLARHATGQQGGDDK